jgi:ankyrin repeat protein
VVALLLEKGAEPDCMDKDGRTPLSWTSERAVMYPKQYEAVVALLQSAIPV